MTRGHAPSTGGALVHDLSGGGGVGGVEAASTGSGSSRSDELDHLKMSPPPPADLQGPDRSPMPSRTSWQDQEAAERRRLLQQEGEFLLQQADEQMPMPQAQDLARRPTRPPIPSGARFSSNHSVVTTDSLSHSEWHHLQAQTYHYDGGNQPPQPNQTTFQQHMAHLAALQSRARATAHIGSSNSSAHHSQYSYNTPTNIASPHPYPQTNSSGLSAERRLGQQDEEMQSLATGNDLAHVLTSNIPTAQLQRRLDLVQQAQAAQAQFVAHQAAQQASAAGAAGQHHSMSPHYPSASPPAAQPPQQQQVVAPVPTLTYSSSHMFATILSNLPNRTWKSKCLEYERLRNHVHKVIHLEQQVKKRQQQEAQGVSSGPASQHVTPENLTRAQRMFWCIVASEWDKVSNFVVEQEQIVSKSLHEWLDMCRAQGHQIPGEGAGVKEEPQQPSGFTHKPTDLHSLNSCAANTIQNAHTPIGASSTPNTNSSAGSSTNPSSAGHSSHSGSSSSGVSGERRGEDSCAVDGVVKEEDTDEATPSSAGGRRISSNRVESGGDAGSKEEDGGPARKRVKQLDGQHSSENSPDTNATTMRKSTRARTGTDDSLETGKVKMERNLSSGSGASSTPISLASTFVHLLKQLVQQSKGESTIETPGATSAGGVTSSSSTPMEVLSDGSSISQQVYSETDLLLCRKFLSIATLSDYLRQFVFLNYTSLWRLLRKYAVHTQKNHSIAAIWNDLLVGGSANASFPSRIFSELWHRLSVISEQMFLKPLCRSSVEEQISSVAKAIGFRQQSPTATMDDTLPNGRNLGDIPLIALANYQDRYFPLDPFAGGVGVKSDGSVAQQGGMKASAPQLCCMCTDEVACPVRLPCHHTFCFQCWMSSPSCGAICPECKQELRGLEDAELFMGWMQGLSLLHLQKQQRLRLQEVERGEMMLLQNQLERSRVEQQRLLATGGQPDVDMRPSSSPPHQHLLQQTQSDQVSRMHGGARALTSQQQVQQSAAAVKAQHVSMLMMSKSERQAERERERSRTDATSGLSTHSPHSPRSPTSPGSASGRSLGGGSTKSTTSSNKKRTNTTMRAQTNAGAAAASAGTHPRMSSGLAMTQPLTSRTLSGLVPQQPTQQMMEQVTPLESNAGLLDDLASNTSHIKALLSTLTGGVQQQRVPDSASHLSSILIPDSTNSAPMAYRRLDELNTQSAAAMMSQPYPYPPQQQIASQQQPFNSTVAGPYYTRGLSLPVAQPFPQLLPSSASPSGAVYPLLPGAAPSPSNSGGYLTQSLGLTPSPAPMSITPQIAPASLASGPVSIPAEVPSAPGSEGADEKLTLPKRGQGYSCHHCKTTKPLPELLICTSKTQASMGSKKCRKKYVSLHSPIINCIAVSGR
jgi:hypothetical protein